VSCGVCGLLCGISGSGICGGGAGGPSPTTGRPRSSFGRDRLASGCVGTLEFESIEVLYGSTPGSTHFAADVGCSLVDMSAPEADVGERESFIEFAPSEGNSIPSPIGARTFEEVTDRKSVVIGASRGRTWKLAGLLSAGLFDRDAISFKESPVRAELEVEGEAGDEGNNDSLLDCFLSMGLVFLSSES